jgi:hypothetical protein
LSLSPALGGRIPQRSHSRFTGDLCCRTSCISAFHGGSYALQLPHELNQIVLWLREKNASVPNPIEGQATLTPEQARQLMAGECIMAGPERPS